MTGPLFGTDGERLLHKWACRDADWLYALSVALAWQQQAVVEAVGAQGSVAVARTS